MMDGAGDRSLLHLTSTALEPSLHAESGEHQRSGDRSPEVAYSAAHNALYLHVSRIMGTLWEIRLTTAAPEKRKEGLLPSLGRDEALWLADQLEGLERLMREQSMVPANPTSLAGLQASPPRHHQLQSRLVGMLAGAGGGGGSGSGGGSQRSRAEAGNLERESLLRLLAWLCKARQVLRLWALLVENQFPALAASLKPETRGSLRQAAFRSLLSGDASDLCAELITALISFYLDDYATTDAVSERLRSVCPQLFTSNDAMAAKASELLSAAKLMDSPAARASNLAEALLLFKKVAGQLDLHAIAPQLAAVEAYEGIVEVVLAAAAAIDPDDLGTAFYRSQGSAEEGGGASLTSKGRLLGAAERQGLPDAAHLFQARMGAYACIGEVLDDLLGPTSAIRNPRLSPASIEAHSEGILRSVLSSKDELAHVATFDWLIHRGLSKKLIHLNSPFLEAYLQRRVSGCLERGAAEGEGGALDEALLDVLWEFYQRQGRLEEAASLLTALARRSGTALSLEQRLRYLSRALSCAKACPSSESATILELEDRLEVGRIQAEVERSLKALLTSAGGSLSQRQRIREAVARLSASLLDLTTLYSDYAEEFDLCEAKLAIIHCAGIEDKDGLVSSVWREILERELALCPYTEPTTRARALSTKFSSLARLYSASPKYFPLEDIAKSLAAKAEAENFAADWLPQTLLEAGLSFAVVLSTFRQLYAQRSQGPGGRRSQERLLNSLLCLLSALWSGEGSGGGGGGVLSSLTRPERRQLSSLALDAVAVAAIDVLKLPDTEATRRLSQGFTAAQQQLRRLSA